MVEATPTLLIVEDDPDIREGLTEILRDEGYDVEAACDGQQALEILQSHRRKPHLVLLDLMMPRMDGWEFMATLRRSDQLLTIPVIVMSAVANELGVPSGVNYVNKPLNTERLLKAIRSACG